MIAQEDAWVYFTDKPNVTAQLSNPNSILSSAAIARKMTHSIVIDERDVPVHEPYITQIKADDSTRCYLGVASLFNGSPSGKTVLFSQFRN